MFNSNGAGVYFSRAYIRGHWVDPIGVRSPSADPVSETRRVEKQDGVLKVYRYTPPGGWEFT